MIYTLGKRVEIAFIYNCATFNARHPEMLTSHRYILNLSAKFTHTGSVTNVKHDNKSFK